MRNFWRLTFILILVTLLSGSTPGRALMKWFASQAWGGGASPKSHHQSIRLDSQEVTIRLGKHSYTVDAVFHFFNTGDTTTEWVGFPNRANVDSDFIRFDAWVEGQKVQASEETHSIDNRIWSGKHNLNRWMAIQVAFPGNAPTTIRMSYEVSYEPIYDNSSRPEIQYWSGYFEYGTSHLWKGNIGKAVYNIDGSAIGGKNGFYVRIPDRDYHWHELTSETSRRLMVKKLKPDPQATMAFYRNAHIDIPRNIIELQKSRMLRLKDNTNIKNVEE